MVGICIQPDPCLEISKLTQQGPTIQARWQGSVQPQFSIFWAEVELISVQFSPTPIPANTVLRSFHRGIRSSSFQFCMQLPHTYYNCRQGRLAIQTYVSQQLLSLSSRSVTSETYVRLYDLTSMFIAILVPFVVIGTVGTVALVASIISQKRSKARRRRHAREEYLDSLGSVSWTSS